MDLRRVAGLLVGVVVGSVLIVVLPAVGVPYAIAAFVALPAMVLSIVKTNERMAGPKTADPPDAGRPDGDAR